MFTKNDFFDSIFANKENGADRIIELLKARGFFIEIEDNKYILSDNSHKNDVKFLNEVLSQYNIGECKGDEISMNSPENFRKLLDLFQEESTRISDDVCYFKKNWKRNKSDYYGEKVPVSYLEPFIAMYVKALSACGLSTALSCDGNHSDRKKVTTNFKGHLYERWHEWIVNNIVDISDLKWNKDYTEIAFRKEEQYYVYYRLLCAANYLYKNRCALRSLRKNSCKWLSKGRMRGRSEDEIFDGIAQQANTLVKETILYDV